MTVPLIRTPLPGPKAKAIIARDAARVSTSYTRDYPFVMARGSGAVVEDVDGNVFLDCAAGIAVTGTGHSHPDVVQAIIDQAQKYLHMSGTDFYYERQVQLAERLAEIVPIAGEVRTFFANSGADCGRGGHEAGEVLDRADQSDCVSRLLPRSDDRRDGGHVEQVRAAAWLRADDARRLSRAVRQLLPVPGRPRAGDLRWKPVWSAMPKSSGSTCSADCGA